MRKPKCIPGRISTEARLALLDFLENSGSREAVVCLIKGRSSDNKGCLDPEERWTYGTYEPENIRAVEPALSSMGQCLLYEFDGMIVAIPQFDKLDEIINKEMVLDKKKGVVFEDYCS